MSINLCKNVFFYFSHLQLSRNVSNLSITLVSFYKSQITDSSLMAICLNVMMLYLAHYFTIFGLKKSHKNFINDHKTSMLR